MSTGAPKGSADRKTRDWVLVLILASSVTLAKLLGLSGPRIPCGQNRTNAGTHLKRCHQDDTECRWNFYRSSWRVTVQMFIVHLHLVLCNVAPTSAVFE